MEKNTWNLSTVDCESPGDKKSTEGLNKYMCVDL